MQKRNAQSQQRYAPALQRCAPSPGQFTPCGKGMPPSQHRSAHPGRGMHWCSRRGMNWRGHRGLRPLQQRYALPVAAVLAVEVCASSAPCVSHVLCRLIAWKKFHLAHKAQVDKLMATPKRFKDPDSGVAASGYSDYLTTENGEGRLKVCAVTPQASPYSSMPQHAAAADTGCLLCIDLYFNTYCLNFACVLWMPSETLMAVLLLRTPLQRGSHN